MKVEIKHCIRTHDLLAFLISIRTWLNSVLITGGTLQNTLYIWIISMLPISGIVHNVRTTHADVNRPGCPVNTFQWGYLACRPSYSGCFYVGCHSQTISSGKDEIFTHLSCENPRNMINCRKFPLIPTCHPRQKRLITTIQRIMYCKAYLFNQSCN